MTDDTYRKRDEYIIPSWMVYSMKYIIDFRIFI